jgi:soluble lytic murein transglycosylase-like protein
MKILQAACALAFCLPVSVLAQNGATQRPMLSKTAPTASASDVDSLVNRFAVENDIDPRLFAALVRQESSGRNNAVSRKGARGLAQLMPGTAARFGVTNPHDPAQNLSGGARYLRYLLDLFGGDVRLALAGYNAGEGAVLKYGRRIPPYAETIDYVNRICAAYYGQAGMARPLVYRTLLARNPAARVTPAVSVSPAPERTATSPKVAIPPPPAKAQTPRSVSSYYW